MQGDVVTILGVGMGLMVLGPTVAIGSLVRNRRKLGTPAQRATLAVLEAANELAPPFRSGLAAGAASGAPCHLKQLLDVEAIALTSDNEILSTTENLGAHEGELIPIIEPVISSGRSRIAALATCGDPNCFSSVAIIVPVIKGAKAVGTLTILTSSVTTGLIRTAEAVARWIATQLDLAELDESRARLAEAELRLLRAQISPHFVYNSLTAIASYVRSDPQRARDLLLGFAEFTRYALAEKGHFATLAEELRIVDHYLELERARFGDRLAVTFRVAPEVLGLSLPAFVIQPLVENAVRHGLSEGKGMVSIVALDEGNECLIYIEDNGKGMDPSKAVDQLHSTRGIGLTNVDERLRQSFGDEYGLTVETNKGAGFRVSLRVPKWAPGVRAS